MVVVFGLFHGLFFLPCLLSLLGPENSPIDEEREEEAQQQQQPSSQQPTAPSSTTSRYCLIHVFTFQGASFPCFHK